MNDDHCELLCLDLPRAEQVRAQIADITPLGVAAERAKALADPSRLRIASALMAGEELCVCDLAWICGLSQNLVSHHLRRLHLARMVTSRREGKLVMYRLTTSAVRLIAELVLPVHVSDETVSPQ